MTKLKGNICSVKRRTDLYYGIDFQRAFDPCVPPAFHQLNLAPHHVIPHPTIVKREIMWLDLGPTQNRGIGLHKSSQSLHVLYVFINHIYFLVFFGVL